MSTLYVTDLDGTLLNNGSFVSARSAEILAEVVQVGALVTAATARTPATVVPLLEQCALRLPYIVMTGAAEFDPVSMTYGERHIMTGATAAMARTVLEGEGIKPFIYRFDAADMGKLIVWHDREMTDEERDFYDERRTLKLKEFRFGDDGCNDTILLFGSGPTAHCQRAAELLRATGSVSVSCYPDIFRSGVSLIEVFATGVSKAAAIRRMARRIGADRVVAFGDNINDLPMFEVADVAVAVGNALSQVKEAADIVIGPNYDDAVAQFIAADFGG